MSSVSCSVYTLKCWPLYTLSLYTPYICLPGHSQFPTSNTSLYIQCGWVEFGSDQDKAVHPHLFNGPVLTIYRYSKCEKNKQGQYFYFSKLNIKSY